MCSLPAWSWYSWSDAAPLCKRRGEESTQTEGGQPKSRTVVKSVVEVDKAPAETKETPDKEVGYRESAQTEIRNT